MFERECVRETGGEGKKQMLWVGQIKMVEGVDDRVV